MLKKILVPLDGSKFSECILRLVKDIATGCSVPQVVLLEVAEPYRPGYDVDEDFRRDAENRAMSTAMEYLSDVAADLKESGLAVETDVVWGQPAEEILNYAKNNQVDMVIMSTHGRSGVSHWLIGSVTERVVRHCVAPVLVAAPSACR
jgi:nucleotide-binding universal stress UspA family protein